MNIYRFRSDSLTDPQLHQFEFAARTPKKLGAPEVVRQPHQCPPQEKCSNNNWGIFRNPRCVQYFGCPGFTKVVGSVPAARLGGIESFNFATFLPRTPIHSGKCLTYRVAGFLGQPSNSAFLADSFVF